MKNDEIFLETTALIDFVFKSSEIRLKISDILATYGHVYSSNYVRAQVRNRYLNYLCVMLKKSMFAYSVADVLEWAKKCTYISFQAYLGNSSSEQIIIYLRDIEEKHKFPEIKAFQSHLRILIRKGWKQIFEDCSFIDDFIDQTKCYTGFLSPPVRKSGYYEVENSKACENNGHGICELEKFCNNDIEDFRNILNKLKKIAKPDEETKNRIQEIQRLLKGRTNFKLKECGFLSDAIIALESNAPEILNNNDKHFLPICESIGKKSVTY